MTMTDDSRSAAQTGSAILAEGLTKSFHDPERGRIEAVRGLDLECRPGEIYGLLGPNGAGKTTTLRMLSTILAPTSGRAAIDGVDVRENPLEGTVYTNSPEAMYILCDVRAQEILTRLSHPTKVEAAATVEEAGAIVWFAPFRSRQPLPKGSFEDFEKYGQGVEVLPLETFVDGAVFRVREP